MYRTCLFLFIILIFNCLNAKPPKKKGEKKNPKQLEEIVITPQNYITSYKGTYKKYFDLLNTKLFLKPVFKDKILIGKAELLLKPYFYNQNRLVLDAKRMKINAVELKTLNGNKKLSYTYDTLLLNIELDKIYTQNDQLSVIIDYIAMPYLKDSLQVETEDGRGLFFIDSEDKNPYKPMHLWTQGEEETGSCWFPTLDAMNQKSSQEVFITIDTNLTSLSNGLLLDTKYNDDGTKTDHWKQDKPHSPYLFFLAAGEYYKTATKWRDKEVSFYTFERYKKDVAEIFKDLPEMMEFFSIKLGVDFPWDKLANIMAYDYTAGAMENSSAVIYYEKLLCDRQQLADGNFDWIIAHELFHQWFGDLVTAETWAYLTLNESMADYSESIWKEYKYGKDEGDGYRIRATEKYLRSSKYKNEPIVNFYYENPHDNFDDIRYEKGGAVLHMLRNYVGDDAFFESLRIYLTEFKFKNAELSDLRKIFEEVTGEDLNWFFNQWWLEKGHPILDITHRYDEENKTIELNVRQTQTSGEGPTFRIPAKVDIYTNGKIETKIIDIDDRVKTFYFPSSSAPQLVNFDADKVLLCEKMEDLSDAENIFKFYNAPKVKDKLEALNALSFKQKNTAVQDLFFKAMQDKSWHVRSEAVDLIDFDKYPNKAQLSLTFQNIINTEAIAEVREAAVSRIAKLEKEKSVEIFEKVIEKDSSYKTMITALNNLRIYNKQKAYDYALKFAATDQPELLMTACKIFKDTTADNFEVFKKAIWLNTGRTFYSNFRSFNEYLENVNTFTLEKAILFLKDIYRYEESDYNKQSARQVVRNLKFYFAEKAKKDSQSAIKYQIVTKVGKDLL